MMRVIVYGRVNQEALIGTRLKEQIEKVTRHCREQGSQIVETVWECCSGSHAGDVLKKAVGMCRNGDADAIAVRDVSRISRNMTESAGIAKEIEDAGCQMIVCS